jgi:protein-disulfide isomerase
MTKKNKNSGKSGRKQRAQQRQNRWLALGIASALLAVLIYFTWQETGLGTALDPALVSDPALGPVDAPVEIVEFGDLGCSACRAWHLYGIRDAVLDTYGEQVRFVWKDFPVITHQSPQAAEAAHCAAAQGRFWDYHDTVYEQFSGLSPTALQNYATLIDLDLDAFDQCLEGGDMRQVVQANLQTARQLGLRGTPGFTINGRVLPAPPSLEQLAELIEQELAGQQLN